MAIAFPKWGQYFNFLSTANRKCLYEVMKKVQRKLNVDNCVEILSKDES